MILAGSLRVGLLIVACALLLTWNALLANYMATALHMNDFGKFYHSARFFLRGEDMYQPNPATWNPVTSTTTGLFLNLNPPHLHLPLLPLALLPPGWALLVWGAASAVCIRVSARLIARALGLAPPPTLTARLTILALFLAFSATAAVVGTGQLSFLIMLPMTLAWIAAREGRWRATGLWLGALISIKPFLLVFVPYLVVRRRFTALGWLFASTALCFVTGLVVFGLAAHRAWLAAVGEVGWTWAVMNASLAGLLDRSFTVNPVFTPVLVAPTFAVWSGAIGAATLVILTGLVVWRDASDEAVDRAFATLIVAALLVSPLGWIYYVWLGLGPALAMVVASAKRRHASWWLVRAGGVLLFVPIVVPNALQPSAVATVLLGSVFFWGIIFFWLAFVLESGGRATTPC